MEYHEYANLFPMMNKDEIAILCDDMRASGYDTACPIVLYSGKILDGRNRQLAADTVGVTANYITFEGTDQEALEFVIRHNLHRRHLNESQRAVIASKLANLQRGGDGSNQYISKSANLHNSISQPKAAAMMNVSPRTVATVKAIEREAPELMPKLESGEMTAHEAHKQIKKKNREEFIEKQVKEIESNLFIPPDGKFNVIVIDPPWPYGTEYDPDGRRSASPYPEMSLDEIGAIELPAADDCILWLWTTHKFMRYSFALLDSWGFRDVAILTWIKDRMGIGSWLRSQSEFCIMGVKGKPTINLTNQTTVINGPLREHSRKPDEFYSMVESLSPGGYKLDYFSRKERDGWVVFGNDTGRF